MFMKYNWNPTNERRDLVESIARLNDWIFDEIAFHQEDPELSKKIVRNKNKLPLNI